MSDGGIIPSFTAVYNSYVNWTESVVPADVDGDSLIDFVSGGLFDNATVWHQNLLCLPGQYSTTGNRPCSPCPGMNGMAHTCIAFVCVGANVSG